MAYEQLKLENQLCFPVYAASRLITREYQPYLNELGITYPQYLVLMVLWENDGMPVNDIAKLLILNTNTVTPLLNRMEKEGLIKKERSSDDERKVLVRLTLKGRRLQESAVLIPDRLSERLLNGSLDIDDIIQLKKGLDSIVDLLTSKTS
jgi:DNA-binding MarR family transcriptional regulator